MVMSLILPSAKDGCHPSLLSGAKASSHLHSLEGWLANRSSFNGGKAHLRAFGATVGNLRLNHERRLVDQIFTSWNRTADWLSRVLGLQRAA